MTMTCNADVVANELMLTLLAGTNFTVPDVDLSQANLKLPDGANADMYAAIVRLKNSDLTERKINGEGSFDALMASVKVHLREEYDKGRITGAEYTKAYSEMVSIAMQNATQFVLSKDQVYWTSQQAQIQAVTAMLMMEQARVQLAALKFEALNTEANYALTKMKLANEDAQYCLSKYQLEQMLPAQKAMLEAQKTGQDIQNTTAQYTFEFLLPKQLEGLTLDNLGKTTANSIASYTLVSMMPKQAAMLEAQKDGQLAQNAILAYQLSQILPGEKAKTAADTNRVIADTAIATYNVSYLLPLQKSTGEYTLNHMMPVQKSLLEKQVAGQELVNLTAAFNKDQMLPEQLKMVKEQTETQRAQTLDTRSDAANVVGYVGKQKDLYNQQIDSYKRDAEIKAARLMSDGWMTQKTIDELALTPASFQQDMVDAVLTAVKTRNGLV